MTASELANYGTALPNIPTPIANNGDTRAPIAGSNNSTDTQASVAFGLPYLMSRPLNNDGIPVPRQDLNGIYNLLSKITHYLMAGGRIPYSANESTAIGGYPNGAEVSYNGHNYKSKADSNTALPTDTTKWDCIDHLPLTGGTMTGSGVINNAHLSNDSISGYTEINGCPYKSNGATLTLYGKNNTIGYGKFDIEAHDGGQNQSNLVGYPNGTLTWKAKNIVRSVNNNNADANGNVSIGVSIQKTLLAGSDDLTSTFGGVDIPLSQSWRNFQYISTVMTYGTSFSSQMIITTIPTASLSTALDSGASVVQIGTSDNQYWDAKGIADGTTDTKFAYKQRETNSYIRAIYGLNLVIQ